MWTRNATGMVPLAVDLEYPDAEAGESSLPLWLPPTPDMALAISGIWFVRYD